MTEQKKPENKEPICPLLSIMPDIVKYERCNPSCALRVPYYMTTEDIPTRGYVCALAAKFLLDSQGRLKV